MDFDDIINQSKKTSKEKNGPSLVDKLKAKIPKREKKAKTEKKPKTKKEKVKKEKVKEAPPTDGKSGLVQKAKEFYKGHKRLVLAGAAAGALTSPFWSPPLVAGIATPVTYAAAKVAAKEFPETERIKNGRSHLESEIKVTYKDGLTAFDSLSEGTKLSFVDYEDINPYMVVAPIAAEDHKFREQELGLSMKGLFRAYLGQAWKPAGKITGIKLGGGGGSTIDVQTTKQLWHGRVTEGALDKFKQYFDAARMARQLSKDEILALYLNSMHVSGELGEGGRRGLSEAANYYFDKDQSELSFEEAAFITATLKGAAMYNPFSGNEASKTRKMEKAKGRMIYTIKHMEDVFPKELARAQQAAEQVERETKQLQALIDGNQIHEDYVADATKELERLRGISEKRKVMSQRFERAYESFKKNSDEVLEKLRDKKYKVKFSKGGSNYLKSTLVSMVEEELKQLEKEGTLQLPLPPGSKVITTINPTMQEASNYQLRHHLSNTSVILDGYDKPQREKESKVNVFEQYKFQFGKVEEIGEDTIKLSFGQTEATVDREGIEELVAAHMMHKKKSNKPWIYNAIKKDIDKHIKDFLKDIKKGDVLYTSVRDVQQEENEEGKLINKVHLNLEQYPASMQGAAVFIGKDNGVKAWVGNIYDKSGALNYALAEKQPGSGFKPIVALAALKNKYDSLESKIRNTPTVYAYGGKKGDNGWEPQEWSVSLGHMGPPVINIWELITQSRNPGTAHLFANLSDKLDEQEQLALATELGLNIKEDETPKEYRVRLRDKYGVGFHGWREVYVEMTKFNIANKQLKKVLPKDEAETLDMLDFGYKYEKSLAKIEREINKHEKALERAKGTSAKHHEEEVAHFKDHIPYVKFNFRYLKGALPSIESTLERIKAAKRLENRETFDQLVGNYLYHNEKTGRVIFSEDELHLPKMNPAELWGMEVKDLEGLLNNDDVVINDLIKIRTAKSLVENVKNMNDQNQYSPEFILNHPDMQLRLAHEYIRKMIKEKVPGLDIGDYVGPSAAIGTKEMSPWQLAQLYNSLLREGKAEFISRVENAEGEPIYIRDAFEGQVDIKPEVVELIYAERGVTTHGTARMNETRYTLDGEEVVMRGKKDFTPFKAGKTGTTNASKEATFSGFFADTNEETFGPSKLGVGAVFVGDYIGRESVYEQLQGKTPKVKAQGMEKYGRNINIFGGGTAGVIYSESIDSVIQVTNELEIPGAKAIYLWPSGKEVEQGSCDNDLSEGYCLKEGKIIGSTGLAKVLKTD